MLSVNVVALIVVDVQGKLAKSMDQSDELFINLERMLQSANVLGIPTLAVEQIPEKLGTTIPQVSRHLVNSNIPAKITFSAMRHEEFVDALAKLNRRHILLTGIEAHVCVYQTALDMMRDGYEVHLVADAVGSRSPKNKQLAIDNLRSAGASITSVEMALFELMEDAEHPKFREIQKIIK